MTITPRMEAVLEILTECAEDGKPCPRNQELADHFGIYSNHNASHWFRGLAEAGYITIKRVGVDKVVTITATGKSTADIPVEVFASKQDKHLAFRERTWERERSTLIVSRDPCRRCGVRGDIGCEHQPRSMPITLSEAGRVHV